MKTKNIERYLNSFGKYIVQQARSNLTKAKKNVDKKLYNSIRFKVVPEGKNLVVQFYMLNYGKFVDKGVSGTKKSQTYKNYKGTVVSSPYKYTNKQPPSGIIEKWIKRKGLKGRVDKSWKSAGNKGGQFISNKSFAFLIARSIKKKGIKSLSFFQRPLGLGMQKFGSKLLGAVKEDVIDSLNETITQTN
tara:strand:+ start:500 stop:1066 length:567 start_codon:yes stop_codon:yes gene_type:complete